MRLKVIDYIPFLVLAILMFVIRVGNYWSWSIFSRYAILLFFGSGLFSFFIARRTSYWFLPLLLVSSLSAVYSSAWNFNTFQGEADMLFRVGLGKDALYALICVVFSSLYLAFAPKRWEIPTTLFLKLTFYLSLIYTLCQWSSDPFARGGFMGNASVNGCLISALYPFSSSKWSKINGIVLLLTLLGIAMTGASQPVGILAVSILSLGFAKAKHKKDVFLVSGCIALLLVGISHFWLGPLMFDPNGRFEIWSKVFKWWADRDLYLFGAGLGSTFHAISTVQLLQVRDGLQAIFFMMHSSWLQILFDLGAVGLLSALCAYLCILKQAKDPRLFASWVAFGAFGVFNYPLQSPIPALCFLLVGSLILFQGKARSVDRL